MKEIAYDDDGFRVRFHQGGIEPGQVRGGIALRQGNAMMPEGGGLPQMQIRQQQGASLFPEGTALRQQSQGLPGTGNADGGGGHEMEVAEMRN